jgi:hypothetical protein
MRIAVVTPYFKEPLEVLKRCHDSVAAQTLPDVTHFMIGDGHGRPEIDAWPCVHIKLPVNHNDYGDTPRVMAANSAATLGYEAIALLDADNWYEPHHLDTLLRAQRETAADVVFGTRTLVRPDGSVMGVDTDSDGENFVDTNCLMFMKAAFPILRQWGFKDPRSGIVGDKVLWSIIRASSAKRTMVTEPTVNYVTTWAYAYVDRGEAPPPGAKFLAPVEGEPYPLMFDYYAEKQRYEEGTGRKA